MLSADEMAALVAGEGLPASYAAAVRRWWTPLATAIAEAAERDGTWGLLVGISGPQGSGKSTACVFLEALLARNHGLRSATLSLDDVYLEREARLALARSTHPLFETRGAPGTHDVALAEATIDALLASSGPVAVPRFDKGADDRAPRDAWPVVDAPVDVLLFEGWCVGATPHAPADLVSPVNALEAEEDGEVVWRGAVNAHLAGDYRALFDRIDLLVMLRPSGFERVAEWRGQQEAALRKRTGRGMDAIALARFIQHYERLTRRMLRELPARADWIVEIGDDHQPNALTPGRGSART